MQTPHSYGASSSALGTERAVILLDEVLLVTSDPFDVFYRPKEGGSDQKPYPYSKRGPKTSRQA